MSKLIYFISFILVFVNCAAEPMGYDSKNRYESVRVFSCETSEKIMRKQADFKKYSRKNKERLLEASKSLIVLEVIPISEVEFITSVYNGKKKQYLGMVTPITNPKNFKVHMQWAGCEAYPKNKEILISISSGYNCMNEYKLEEETNPACLINDEIANEVHATGGR